VGAEARTIVSRHASLYRRLLVGYPAAFRRDYAEEMTGLFEDLLADARRSGERFAGLRLWIWAITDLITTATHERMEDAMNNHPVVTRILLVAVPVAGLAGLGIVGPALAVSVLALGVALLALRWSSLGSALRVSGRGRWWVAPLVGLALVGASFGVTQLPGRGDYIWGLASLLFLVGAATTIGSVLLWLIAWTRRPTAPSAG